LNTPRNVLRAGIVAIVAVMLILLLSASFGGTLPARAAPAAQDGTDYPIDDETLTLDGFDDDYPNETDIPFEDETPFDFETFEAIETPGVPTITLTPTGTLAPNTFLTESAEMSGGQITPPPSETPGPTITAFQTPTAATATPRSTRAPASSDSGGIVDWGFFSLGFAVPVMAACGLVLYLLDRRPELFRPRK